MTDGSPGWFRDPSDASLARWHDGERWTEHTLVIADQTPGVEPPPPDITDDATLATPIVSEPEFHIPRPSRGSGSWPTWAKVAAPVALIAIALGAWLATSGGDDDPDEDTATVDTVAASLDEAVDAARRVGLPDEVSDAKAASFIERICGATTRPTAVDQLGEDLGRDLGQVPGTSVSSLRQSVRALGVGAELRCEDDLESAPDLIDDLQDLAVAAFSSATTAVTIEATDEGTDGGEAAAADGGDGDGTSGTTRTTRRTAAAPTTTRPPTTTTTRPPPQVLKGAACSSAGATAQDKFTGESLTCKKSCLGGSGLNWRSSAPCPTTTTAPAAPPPTFPTSTVGGGTGGTGGPTTGGT